MPGLHFPSSQLLFALRLYRNADSFRAFSDSLSSQILVSVHSLTTAENDGRVPIS